MKKISIIVPMYNAEDTIEECINSLASQTIFNDIEVLLVDDFSDDNTVLRSLQFEHRYPDNILIIKLSENGGPGRARNIAMEYAQGEYIGYVDADDAVVPEMYEKLYNEAVRTGADVVDCGFYNESEDIAIVYASDDLTGIPNNYKRSELIVSGGYIWSKIFRRDFLLSQDIKFREEYILEDMDYLMEIFCKMKSISNVKEILYIYRRRGESLSKTKDVNKYLHSTMSAMKAIYDKLSIMEFYDGIREAVEYAILQLYSFSVNINIKAVKEGQRSMEETLNSLNTLRQLRKQIASRGYDNRYVQSKIKEKDIRLMEENDAMPDLFLNG